MTHTLRRPLRLLATIALLAAVSGCESRAPRTPDSAPASAGSDIAKPAIDHREYAHMTLDNGLVVLTVSDPRADKAAAALSVATGSFDEPEDLPGLAHFLEHMLFLGTDRFPEPDDYHEFIAANGGSSNAYTGADHTNYFFDIKPQRFDAALERFSRFFIAPRLDPGYVGRERDAVNAEFELQKKADNWRAQAAQRQIFNPRHPASRFSIGNRETLHDLPRGDLASLVRQFFETHYSAQRMALVLLAPQDTATLQATARRLFAEVPRRDGGGARPAPPLVEVSTLPARLALQPIKEHRQVSFVFPLPAIEPYWRIKPTRYIASLLGHEGAGSLHAWLKSRGWIESLSAGGRNVDSANALFEVSIELTAQGAGHVDEIGNALFAYLDLIRRGGVRPWRYDEDARLAALAFNYQEAARPSSYVYYLSANLVYYPPPDVLRAPYVMEQFDARLIRDYLDRMVVPNLILEIIDPDAETTGATPYFEVPFSTGRLADGRLERWSDPQLPDGISLPAPNPFVPENLELVQPPEPAAVPRQLLDDAQLSLWHGIDTSFEVPRTSLFIRLESPAGAASPRDWAANTLYTQLVRDALNAYAYPAQLAGLSYAIQPDAQGVAISLGGYSARQPELLARVLEEYHDHTISPEKFATARAEIARRWRNARLDRPYTQAMAELDRMLTTPSHDPQMLADIVEKLSVQDVVDWRRRLQRQLSATVMVYGNVDASGARATARQVRSVMLSGAEPADVPPRQTLVLDDQPWLRILDIDHDDAAMVLYVQGRTDSVPERATYGLLAQMLRPAYFNALRTEQKLGYVVAAGPRVLRRTPGINFIVQSPVAPLRVLVERTRAFVDGFCLDLRNISPAEFADHRSGLIARLTEDDKQLAARAGRLWSDLSTGFEGFDSRDQLAAAVAALQPPAVQTACTTLQRDLVSRHLLVGAEGRFRGITDPPAGVLTDPVAFRRDRPRFPE